MGQKTENFYVCDCCGAERIDPVRGSERGPTKYEIFASEDMGVAGGAVIKWKDLCKDCHRIAARFVSDMRKHQNSVRAATPRPDTEGKTK
jgi:hypothetical protein